MPNDRKIVADKDNRETKSIPHLSQEVYDLRLNRNVCRRGRFVADEDFRLENQSAREHDALTLAAAELMRKTIP